MLHRLITQLNTHLSNEYPVGLEHLGVVMATSEQLPHFAPQCFRHALAHQRTHLWTEIDMRGKLIYNLYINR